MNVSRSVTSLLVWYVLLAGSTLAQDSFEVRLDRLEAKLDTLLSYHRVVGQDGTENDVLRDGSNLLWGIGGRFGSVMDKDFFVVNHNDNWKIPYWVAYYLSASNLQGNQSRTDDFRPDPQLAAGERAELVDYRHSGFDRGHNAPAGAFKRSREAMSTTFLLSNMSPQTPALNRRIWRDLEAQIRDLVLADGEAWVVTGNVFMSSDSHFVTPFEFIGNGRVAIPSHCFKAVLSSRDDGDYSMFAFLMPNQRDRLPGDPGNYILSVNRLEEITGYDFFPDLPDDIENRLEDQVADTWPY